jgi:YidC/Oxa1 family membrane protein insertase
MWPLVKKQLHHAKAMRELQPELKRIKQAAAGNRQQESVMVMELYKERQINPFSSLGIIILQLPILIGLYSGLRRIIDDPHAIINFSYPVLHHLPWLKVLATDIHKFDGSLFGIVDLTRSALEKTGGIYWPAMVIVAGSALAQYYQSKQLLPNTKDSRGLRSILRDAGQGKKTDQGEVNAAVGRSTRYLIPGMIFLVTVNIASALSLYWLVGGVTAYLQQAKVLKTDETELEAVADKTTAKPVIEGEVVKTRAKGEALPAGRQGQRSKKNSRRKRRKR